MGVVHSPEMIIAGNIPEADGSSHILARKELIEGLKTDSRMQHDVSATVYGSSATGNANRRSDFDVFLTYFMPAGEAAFAQQAAINALLLKIIKEHHVPLELKRYPEGDLEGPCPRKIDPMYAGHLIDIEDRHSECSHLKPAHRLLSAQALTVSGITVAHLPFLTQATIKYAENRSGMFLESIGSGINFKKLQRGLETPKALGRKTLILCDVMGDLSTDVTSRADMDARLQALFQLLPGGRQMSSLHEKLNIFDKECTDMLEHALASGEVGAYERWLEANHEEIYRLAYELTRDFGIFTRTLLSDHESATIEWGRGEIVRQDQDVYEDDQA